jgi:hypothetical protein
VAASEQWQIAPRHVVGGIACFYRRMHYAIEWADSFECSACCVVVSRVRSFVRELNVQLSGIDDSGVGLYAAI